MTSDFISMVIVIPGKVVDGTVVDIAVGKKKEQNQHFFCRWFPLLRKGPRPAAIPKKLKKKHQTKQSKHTRDDGKELR